MSRAGRVGSAVEGATDGGQQPWERFEELLAKERDAATRADVDVLVSLQVAKRQVLDELKSRELPADILAEIHRRAQANVTLIRQLVQCLGALAGNQPPTGTYDAQGQRPGHLRPSLRGTL